MPVLPTATPLIPDALTDRQADMLEPLLAIAELAGPEWAERARAALVAICSSGEDQSVGIQLLASCRAIFTEKDRDAISTQDLLNALIQVEDANAPWPQWWSADISRSNIHGPASKLARMLEPYGIKPRAIHDADESRGYWRDDFADSFARYLPALTFETKELF